MQYLCLLATQRSGSTWVMDAIQRSSGSKAVLGELFLDRPARSPDPWNEPWGNLVPPVRFWDWRRSANVSWLKAPRAYLAFLDVMYRRTESLMAFKLMYSQLLRKPHLVMSLRQRKYTVIHLVRRNLFATYVSKCDMHVKKQHTRESFDDDTFRPRTLDPKAVYSFINRELAKRATAGWLLRTAKVPVCQLFYEDLAVQDSAAIQELSEAVGHPVDLQSEGGLQRVSKRSLKDRVYNHHEVMAYLMNTRISTVHFTET